MLNAHCSNAYDTKAGCQIPLRDTARKGGVAASLQPLTNCQIYTCFIESGPPHLKCTTLILPALPLTSLFAWKPPHDLAGINSSKLGGHIYLSAIIAHINKKLLTVLFWTIIVWCAQRALLKRLRHEGGLPDSAPRHNQKRSVAASLQPLTNCQIYTCFIESGPPHLKCTTLILPALPLTSLFAWKPPHNLAGINSSKLGGHIHLSAIIAHINKKLLTVLFWQCYCDVLNTHCSNAYDTKAGCQIPLRDTARKGA